MIGLNRSILFNSVRRPKIQDLEIFVSGTVLIPFHDLTSFIIIFLPNLYYCPKTFTGQRLSKNCPKFKTAQNRTRDTNPEWSQIQNCSNSNIRTQKYLFS